MYAYDDGDVRTTGTVFGERAHVEIDIDDIYGVRPIWAPRSVRVPGTLLTHACSGVHSFDDLLVSTNVLLISLHTAITALIISVSPRTW